MPRDDLQTLVAVYVHRLNLEFRWQFAYSCTIGLSSLYQPKRTSTWDGVTYTERIEKCRLAYQRRQFLYVHCVNKFFVLDAIKFNENARHPISCPESSGSLASGWSPGETAAGQTAWRLWLRDTQSRTQSPLAFWSAGGRQKRLGNSKKFKFFDWLPCNDFHCFTAEILR